MLTSLYQALIARLAPLNLPVYLADCVPAGTAFPYITAQLEAPLTAAASGHVTLTVWCSSDTANAERLAQADALLSLLPARGLWLSTDSGATLFRQEGDTACVQEESARGLRSTWRLHIYPSA